MPSKLPPKGKKENGKESEVGSAKHILIIDDEKPIAHALQLKLEKIGYRVTTFRNAEEALKAAKAQRFDLVLLDIIMPEMNGFTFLSMLKEGGATGVDRVVMFSSLAQEEDIDRAKALGAMDYLVKARYPVSAIIEKVRTIVPL